MPAMCGGVFMKQYFSYFNHIFFMIKRVYALDKRAVWIKAPLKLTAIVQVFIPLFFVREILTAIQKGSDISYVLMLVGAFGGITLLCNLLKELFNRLDERQSDNMYRLVRKDIAQLITRMPYYEVETANTRDFIQLVQNNVDISQLFNTIFDFFQKLVTLCGLVAIVITLHPLFLLLLIIVLLTRMFADRGIRHLWEKWRGPVNTAYRRVNYMLSVMNNAKYGKEIRINGLQQWFVGKMEDDIGGYIGEMKRYNAAREKRKALVEGSALLQECIVYFVLAYQVVWNHMPIGDYSMYLTGIIRLSQCLSSIVDSFSELLKQGEFLGQYRTLLERFPKETGSDKPAYEIENNKDMTISFEHVSFCYPDSDRLILDDVNFTIKANQSLSIVGINGAGKTTIVKLICRFYKPSKGNILLNGVNIDLINEDAYRKLLGVVFQDFQLFAFSVLENVALKSSCDEKKLLDSLQKSGLTEKIEHLKEGVHTVISKEFDDYGIDFSGGESQRLEFARVLYKESKIAIFDEPAASLDPVTEYNMYHTMHEMTENKLTIFISHRLASTKFTDAILVLQDGHVAEYGSFDELMKYPDGVFYNMYVLQQQHYKK